MPNYSRTNADGSREVREELYDGTARVTTTSADGDVTTVLVASDEQQPVEEQPAPEVVAAATIAEEIDARLAPAGVNSIAEVKSAIREGLEAAVVRLGG